MPSLCCILYEILIYYLIISKVFLDYINYKLISSYLLYLLHVQIIFSLLWLYQFKQINIQLNTNIASDIFHFRFFFLKTVKTFNIKKKHILPGFERFIRITGN